MKQLEEKVVTDRLSLKLSETKNLVIFKITTPSQPTLLLSLNYAEAGNMIDYLEASMMTIEARGGDEQELKNAEDNKEELGCEGEDK